MSDAIALCRATIAAHSKSFALASRVLAPLCRDRAAVIYTWCRHADDAVDLAPPEDQPAALARLRAELDSVYAGEPQSDVVLAAFQEVVQDCRIPRIYPDELLVGMEMDVHGQRYDTMDTLLLYCFRVAGTVGLMMSHVMGLSDDSALRNAAHLGMAMQITNICRDVVEDWERDRLYVPADVLAACAGAKLGAALGARLGAGQPFPPEARALMARAVERLLADAAVYYHSGDRGLPSLPWRCAFAVCAARLVYAAIGARIARQAHDVTAGRAVVPTWHKLLLVARAGTRTAASLPARAVRTLQPGWRAPDIPRARIEFPHGVLPL